VVARTSTGSLSSTMGDGHLAGSSSSFDKDFNSALRLLTSVTRLLNTSPWVKGSWSSMGGTNRLGDEEEATAALEGLKGAVTRESSAVEDEDTPVGLAGGSTGGSLAVEEEEEDISKGIAASMDDDEEWADEEEWAGDEEGATAGAAPPVEDEGGYAVMVSSPIDSVSREAGGKNMRMAVAIQGTSKSCAVAGSMKSSVSSATLSKVPMGWLNE